MKRLAAILLLALILPLCFSCDDESVVDKSTEAQIIPPVADEPPERIPFPH